MLARHHTGHHSRWRRHWARMVGNTNDYPKLVVQNTMQLSREVAGQLAPQTCLERMQGKSCASVQRPQEVGLSQREEAHVALEDQKTPGAYT